MRRWPQVFAFRTLAFFAAFVCFALVLRAGPPTPPSGASAPESPPPAEADTAAEPEEPAPAATDAIARRILQNFITVAGGADNLKHIALIKATGTEYPLTKDTVPYKFTYWIAPPDKARLDTVEQEKYNQVQEIDEAVIGANGWSFDVHAKNPFVDDVPSSKLPQLVRLADFIYPYLDYDSRGIRYQYTGQEKFRGLTALVVKAWPPHGTPEYLYFDPNNFLLLRIRRDAKIGTAHTWGNTYFTKYEKVGGFWFPTVWEYALSDAVYARTEVDKIELLPADPSVFHAPVVREIVLRQANLPKTPAPGAAPASPASPGPASP